MAIAGDTVWELRSGATAGNVNGGGFSAIQAVASGGTGVDYSQQNGAQYSLTGLTSAGAGNVILTASAAADMQGNLIHITAGTNFNVGWYTINSVVAGVSLTCSTNGASQSVASGIGAAGTGEIGGAISLGAANDDAVFEATAVANIMWMKAGTYTLGGVVSIARSSSAANPIMVFGYNTTRGDNPKGTNVNGLTRPIIDSGANNFTVGAQWLWKYVEFTSASISGLIPGTRSNYEYCKMLNTTTTDFRSAIAPSVGSAFYMCEIQSYRGYGVLTSSASVLLLNCYIHDSRYGVANNQASAPIYVVNCVFRNINVDSARMVGATTYKVYLINCTFHGCNNTGQALNHPTGNANAALTGSNISNFATGVLVTDATQGMLDEYNNYFDNTTDVTLWTKGTGDVAVDPGFAVTDVTGTAATTSGSVLTDGSKDFTALGVVAGRDFLFITSGTGVTTGYYGITVVGTTTLTLDIAPGTDATADKVYQISVGANFAPGAGIRAVGNPGVLPGGYTTGYQDIGAIQARATGSSEAGLSLIGPRLT